MFSVDNKKEDGKINWEKKASEIERQIRAFYPWPGTFTKFGIKKLKIIEVSLYLDKKDIKEHFRMVKLQMDRLKKKIDNVESM